MPSLRESFQIGVSGSPTACHEDFGDDGASKGCSSLRVRSLFLGGTPCCVGQACNVND